MVDHICRIDCKKLIEQAKSVEVSSINNTRVNFIGFSLFSLLILCHVFVSVSFGYLGKFRCLL
jgi:hypothetical protein